MITERSREILLFDVESAGRAGLRAYEVDGLSARRAELQRLGVLDPPS